MTKYRVITENGYTDFTQNNEDCQNYHSTHGIGEIQVIEVPNIFNLEAWKADVNQLHNELFASYYTPLKYESEADIALTALNSAQYAQEALSLAKWRNDTYDIIDAVTEQQAQLISPEAFINSLPEYV